MVEAATLGEYFRLLITLMFGMKAREIHTVSKSLDHVSCKTNGKVVLEQKGMFRWGRLPPEHRVL